MEHTPKTSRIEEERGLQRTPRLHASTQVIQGFNGACVGHFLMQPEP